METSRLTSRGRRQVGGGFDWLGGSAEAIDKESPAPLASTRTGGLDIAHGPMSSNGHPDCGVPSATDLVKNA